MALHSVREQDIFSHIHRVCGHMSDPYIKWHRENSKNAKFSDADAKVSGAKVQKLPYPLDGPSLSKADTRRPKQRLMTWLRYHTER